MAIPLLTTAFRAMVEFAKRDAEKNNKSLMHRTKIAGFEYMLTPQDAEGADELFGKLKQGLNTVLATLGRFKAVEFAYDQRILIAGIAAINYYTYPESEKKYREMLSEFICLQTPELLNLQSSTEITKAIEIVKYTGALSDNPELEKGMQYYQEQLAGKLKAIKRAGPAPRK